MRKFTKYPQGYVQANSYAEVPAEVQDALGKEVDRLRRKDLFKGRIPKKIKDETLAYMDEEGVSLADAFAWACREYAPKGSELWKAWYYSDFRKFIPSEYDPKYLDFKKYPLKYVQSSTAIKASTEYTSNNPLRVECPRGPYYVWEEFGKFKGSVNNPDAPIVDARKINTFDGFDSLDEVVEYVKKYF